MQIKKIPEIYKNLPWSELDSSLREALPLLKDDIKKANDIIKIGIPEALPVLPHLLRWTKDCNWPVARVLLPFLLTFDKYLIPEVRNILSGHDEIWASWILNEVLWNLSDTTVSILKPTLEVLTQVESEEDIDIVSKELLERIL